MEEGKNLGRPRAFDSPEQMQEKIDAYFESCAPFERYWDEEAGEHKVRAISPKPLTIEGLASFLNIDVDTLRNYEKAAGYEDFFGTVKKAKAKVQANMIERALVGDYNSAVSIFLMKNNFGYKDKSEYEHSGKDGGDIQYNHKINEHRIVIERYDDKDA